jgi:hypothetical protein
LSGGDYGSNVFGGFLVSLVQQQLSGELLLVINPKICWFSLEEFNSRGNKLAQQIKQTCAEEACYLLEE